MRILFYATLCALIAPVANASRLVATSGEQKVQLVELYSSESCSSCPPADKWASTLQTRTGLWKSFVPVVFHVDYWNDLGWKDGLSSNSMTLRQREVAQMWSEPSVYTPAVVVDGKEWRAWSTGQSFPKAEASSKIHLSIYEEKDGAFEVQLKGLPTSGQYTIRIARLGMNMNSKVTAGENSGRLLQHNFVVLDWSSKSVSSRDAKVSFKIGGKSNPPKMAIAAWIEKAGEPRPLQAAGGYL